MINVGKYTRWWQLKYFLMFTPKIGEDDFHFDSYLFRWVGSTTNLIYHDNVAKKRSTLTILTPPMERPDPPSDTPGASKKVFLTSQGFLGKLFSGKKNQRLALESSGHGGYHDWHRVLDGGGGSNSGDPRNAPSLKLPSRGLTYPPDVWHIWRWFSELPQVGYVNFLEGNIAPETLGLEDEFPFWEGYVARCYVGFGECSRFLEKIRVV